MGEALKPCPFCGEPAEIWKASERLDLPAWIACMGRCSVLVSREYKTTEEAVAAWNTRADTEAERRGREAGIREAAARCEPGEVTHYGSEPHDMCKAAILALLQQEDKT